MMFDALGFKEQERMMRSRYGLAGMVMAWVICLTPHGAMAVELKAMDYHNPVKAVSLQDYGATGDQPLIRVSFKEPVSKAYVTESLYVMTRGETPQPVPFTVKQQTVPETVRAMLKAKGLPEPSGHTVWLLEPAITLPADTLFSVKVRNTSPPTATSNKPGGVQDLTVYQFKTEKRVKTGAFTKMFDPSSWHGCGEDC